MRLQIAVAALLASSSAIVLPVNPSNNTNVDINDPSIPKNASDAVQALGRPFDGSERLQSVLMTTTSLPTDDTVPPKFGDVSRLSLVCKVLVTLVCAFLGAVPGILLQLWRASFLYSCAGNKFTSCV